MPDPRTIVLLLMLTPAATAVAAPDGGASLRGVDTVAVTIQGLDRDIATRDFNAAGLRGMIAGRLADAGLHVIDGGDLDAHPGTVVLTLRLSLIRAPYYFFLYGINLAARQRLPLDGDNRAYTTIETWSAGQNGMLLPSNLDKLNDVSLKLADKFIREYRRQNSS